MYGALKYVTIITLEARQYAGCYWRRVAHVLLNRPTDASLMKLNCTPLIVDRCCIAGGRGVSARANDSAARHVRGSIAVWVSGGGCAIAELENA